MSLDKYLRRPDSEVVIKEGKYEKYNLRENPFPSSPFVNPHSSDPRSNGDIYETSIRNQEYSLLSKNFLEVPQTDPNHLRFGYIIDTSYIGRGNGKSAFLINLQKKINADFAFSVSNGQNRCFAFTMVPEAGGKTKTVEKFVDLCAQGIFDSDIINDSLATLRLEAILAVYSTFNIEEHFKNEGDIREKLNSINWFSTNKIDAKRVNDHVISNKYLQNLPSDFPVYSKGLFTLDLVNQDTFKEYYLNLKRGKFRIEFVFSHLVSLFLAAGFTGAYVFVDDFERIPDFQSERQKRDFALELRTCMFDGLNTNAKIGFYELILVLHAGVPRLIQSAWDQSGLEQRAPIFFNGTPKHVIRFEKITLEDTYSLLLKYLHEYRINQTSTDELSPFTKAAVMKMAELGEFNTSKILKLAYETLERAVDGNITTIDADFIVVDESAELGEQRRVSDIYDAPTKNLMRESE
jgi:hypothetical protein